MAMYMAARAAGSGGGAAEVWARARRTRAAAQAPVLWEGPQLHSRGCPLPPRAHLPCAGGWGWPLRGARATWPAGRL